MSGPGEGPEGAEPDTEPDTVQPASTDEAGDAVPAEPEWKRRRRLAEAFGGDQHATDKGDDWYRNEVPPHHG